MIRSYFLALSESSKILGFQETLIRNFYEQASWDQQTGDLYRDHYNGRQGSVLCSPYSYVHEILLSLHRHGNTF